MMAMTLSLSADELLTTTRSVRRRLDLSRPVERDVVEECLRMAFQAPTGQNHQNWGWVVVDNPAIRREMAELYRAGQVDHAQRARSPREPVVERTAAADRMAGSVFYLLEHMHEVPVLLVPTVARSYDERTSFGVASTWGSILPAVWSFMLALRSRGLGSAWTTLHLYREAEMATLLGIPSDQVQVGLFPVAYTLGTDFRPADRAASEERIFWNRWSD
jgi:nitroreductase